MLMLTPHPSKWRGRSGGYLTYLRNTAYLHSWDPISVPFTVDGTMDIHTPVFLPRRRQRLYVGYIIPAVWVKSSYIYWPFCCLISLLPSVRSCVWYSEQNLTQSHRAATRFPVTTYNTVQFTFSVWVGSDISRPACLTRNPVIAWLGMCSVTPWKRAGGVIRPKYY